jgi:hypothetical protein
LDHAGKSATKQSHNGCDRERDPEHRRIDCEAGDARQDPRAEQDQGRAASLAPPTGQQAAGRREHEGLRQQLPHYPAAARSKRRPHRQFGAPLRVARQQKVESR